MTTYYKAWINWAGKLEVSSAVPRIINDRYLYLNEQDASTGAWGGRSQHWLNTVATSRTEAVELLLESLRATRGQRLESLRLLDAAILQCETYSDASDL